MLWFMEEFENKLIIYFWNLTVIIHKLYTINKTVKRTIKLDLKYGKVIYEPTTYIDKDLIFGILSPGNSVGSSVILLTNEAFLILTFN